MRTAIVNIPILDEKQPGQYSPGYLDEGCSNPSVAVYSLASILAKYEYDITVVDLTCDDIFDKNSADKLMGFDVVLLSANSLNWPGCLQLIRWIKSEAPEIILVLGGVHASLFGDQLASVIPVDFIVQGEGEFVLPRLMEAIKNRKGYEKIPGLIMRDKNGRVSIAHLPPLLSSADLDNLPPPLYEQLPEKKYKALSLETSRGCVHSCRFCATLYHGCWRPRSPKGLADLVEELTPYLQKTKLEYFAIVDDCFTTSRKRVFSFLDEIDRRGIPFKATYDARVIDFLDESLLERIKPYSQTVLLGAESISQETLTIVKKPLKKEDIEASAQKVAKHGMNDRVLYSFIIGFPWESKNDILQNVREIANLVLDYGIHVIFQWHALTPGSEMWKSYENKKLISFKDLDAIGYYTGQKCIELSHQISVNEILDISDTIISLQKMVGVYKPFGFNTGEILFSIPFYFKKNREKYREWRENYVTRLATCRNF